MWLQLAIGVSFENMDTSHGAFQSELVMDTFKSGKLFHSFNDDILIPLIAFTTVEDEDARNQVIRNVATVREHHLKDIEDAFWTQWKEIDTVYLPYAEESPQLAFHEFVTDHCFVIIANIVKEAEE